MQSSLWIWELPRVLGGDVGRISEEAQRLGLSAVIVKAWDGTTWWPQFEQVLKIQGVEVWAWGYCYGEEPAAEVAMARKALELGAARVVLDCEAEFEASGGDKRAAALTAPLKDVQDRVGLTSFAFPHLHPSFPWGMFASRVSFLMPQVYFQDMQLGPAFALKTSVAQLKHYKLPIYPVGQAYGIVSGQQIGQFYRAARDLGLSHVSWWEWSQATPEQLQAIAQK